jgi:hypothetical protein
MPEGMTGEALLKAFCALGFEFSHRLKDEVEKGLGNQHNKNIGKILSRKFIKGSSGPGVGQSVFFHLPGALPIFSLPLSA